MTRKFDPDEKPSSSPLRNTVAAFTTAGMVVSLAITPFVAYENIHRPQKTDDKTPLVEFDRCAFDPVLLGCANIAQKHILQGQAARMDARIEPGSMQDLKQVLERSGMDISGMKFGDLRP